MKFYKEIEYTKEITCPYCGHEISDSWEMYGDKETKEICSTRKKTQVATCKYRTNGRCHALADAFLCDGICPCAAYETIGEKEGKEK